MRPDPTRPRDMPDKLLRCGILIASNLATAAVAALEVISAVRVGTWENSVITTFACLLVWPAVYFAVAFVMDKAWTFSEWRRIRRTRVRYSGR